MERGREGRKRINSQREMDDLQRKIREAALTRDGRLRTYGPSPKLNEDQVDLFFSEITVLIWDHKSFMDKKAFVAEVQEDIDEKLKRARERIELIVKDLGGISEKTRKDLINPFMKKLKTEMERCLKKPPNRMDQIVNEVVCMCPRSDAWKKREDDLTKRIVGLYATYTPLKKKDGKINVSEITHNLALIFKACDISDIGEEALRKRISSILPA